MPGRYAFPAFLLVFPRFFVRCSPPGLTGPLVKSVSAVYQGTTFRLLISSYGLSALDPDPDDKTLS
jgi:hypothetical protein